MLARKQLMNSGVGGCRILECSCTDLGIHAADSTVSSTRPQGISGSLPAYVTAIKLGKQGFTIITSGWVCSQ